MDRGFDMKYDQNRAIRLFVVWTAVFFIKGAFIGWLLHGLVKP